MPLAQGVPFIDTAWLSQLAGYGMINRFGVAGAQFIYAGLISLSFALILGAVYRRTGSLIACLTTLLVFGWGATSSCL